MNQRVEVLGSGFEVFSLFRHLTENYPTRYSFLLESIGDMDRPLYSFICLEPDYLLKIKDGKTEIEEVFSERGEAVLTDIGEKSESPTPQTAIDDRVENRIEALDTISKRMPRVTLSRPDVFPRQVFYGGYLGYLAYDIVAPWVGFKSTAKTPDALLGLHTKVLIYDHGREELLYVDNAIDGRREGAQKIKRALNSYRRYERSYPEVELAPTGFKSNTSQEEYSQMVAKAKEYILDGDIFQVVLSRRVARRTEVDGLDIYGALRRLNPSPYMYYLNFGDLRFIGSSPEALVSLNGRDITTVPIAGTRRRGRNGEDEAAMERELTTDPKERAEHVMLVDLARNDVSKVSEPGTV